MNVLSEAMKQKFGYDTMPSQQRHIQNVKLFLRNVGHHLIIIVNVDLFGTVVADLAFTIVQLFAISQWTQKSSSAHPFLNLWNIA